MAASVTRPTTPLGASPTCKQECGCLIDMMAAHHQMAIEMAEMEASAAAFLMG